jgi:hypothetical protein
LFPTGITLDVAVGVPEGVVVREEAVADAVLAD